MKEANQRTLLFSLAQMHVEVANTRSGNVKKHIAAHFKHFRYNIEIQFLPSIC